MKILVLTIFEVGRFIVTWFVFILALWYFTGGDPALGILLFILWLTLLED